MSEFTDLHWQGLAGLSNVRSEAHWEFSCAWLRGFGYCGEVEIVQDSKISEDKRNV